MTDRPAKEVYNKTKNIIKYNTHNLVQGPTVNYYTVKQKVCKDYSSKQFEKAIQALKHNNEILVLNRGNSKELTLWDLDRLTQIQENESEKKEPNKNLIGHINQIKAKI